jgi:replicative DNA helicase
MTADASLISLELEQALLGAILIDPGVLERVDGQVVAADFGDPVHQRLMKDFS